MQVEGEVDGCSRMDAEGGQLQGLKYLYNRQCELIRKHGSNDSKKKS